MRLSPTDAENLSIVRPDLSSVGQSMSRRAIDNILETALTNFP